MHPQLDHVTDQNVIAHCPTPAHPVILIRPFIRILLISSHHHLAIEGIHQMKGMMRVILHHPTVILRHDQIVIIHQYDRVNVRISDLIPHHVRINVILLQDQKNIQVLHLQSQELVNNLLINIVVHLNITSLVEDVLVLMTMIQNPIVVHHQGTHIHSQRVHRRKSHSTTKKQTVPQDQNRNFKRHYLLQQRHLLFEHVIITITPKLIL